MMELGDGFRDLLSQSPLFKDEKLKPREANITPEWQPRLLYSQTSALPPDKTSFVIKSNWIVQLAVISLMAKPFVTVVSFLGNSFNHYYMVLIEHLSYAKTIEDIAENKENRTLPS